MNTIILQPEAQATFDALATDKSQKKVYNAVAKAFKLMEANLRHPGLHTHKYDSLTGPEGQDVFEAYAQNKTPGAWRIFWYYGPGQGELTVIAITPHP